MGAGWVSAAKSELVGTATAGSTMATMKVWRQAANGRLLSAQEER
jgi:hypothetical protein